MSNYADGRVLLMERTEAIAFATSEATVTIPTVGSTKLIRPMFMEICELDQDLLVRINNDATAQDQLTVTAADLFSNAARDDIRGGTCYDSVMPAISDNLTVDAAANITVPTNAVELIVLQCTDDGFTYAVGASGTPTPIISIPTAQVSFGLPYRIFVNDGDVIRMVKITGASTLRCLWRLAS